MSICTELLWPEELLNAHLLIRDSEERDSWIDHRMRMRSPSCHNVDSYSVTFTDMKLFSDIKVSTVIYQRAN